jgi:hypothetical protein
MKYRLLKNGVPVKDQTGQIVQDDAAQKLVEEARFLLGAIFLTLKLGLITEV